jgi:hypothetical protein
MSFPTSSVEAKNKTKFPSFLMRDDSKAAGDDIDEANGVDTTGDEINETTGDDMNMNKNNGENSKPVVQDLPKKEQMQAPPKKEKRKQKAPQPLKKQDPNAAAVSKKNLFGKEKKKPRAEYQAEIDELKKELSAVNSALSATQKQLTETNQKYGTLSEWAERAPIPSI